jgi:hypothetical protein
MELWGISLKDELITIYLLSKQSYKKYLHLEESKLMSSLLQQGKVFIRKQSDEYFKEIAIREKEAKLYPLQKIFRWLLCQP